MVPLALGTDGGGSIRIPCGFCGLPGLKPTYGRVPAWPASPFGSVAHAGPMARTVTDLALLLDVIAEPDARDWTALVAPAGSFSEGLEQGVTGMRMAFSANLGYASVDGEVADAVERAARAFETLGAHVEAVDPGFADPRETFDALWAAGAARAAADLGAEPPQGIDPGFAATVAVGGRIALLDYLAEQQRRDDLGRRSSLFLADWDVLLTPTLPIPAFGAGRDVPEDSGLEGWSSWTPFTYPFNLTQQPAVTVPCGFTRSGLPIGLQIVGPRHGDALVLRIARAYESAYPQPTLRTPAIPG
jgi:aspartyl-tRNA(Asn)/glutamyl-tRNA(Gln) amidotransferase subunit A